MSAIPAYLAKVGFPFLTYLEASVSPKWVNERKINSTKKPVCEQLKSKAQALGSEDQHSRV